MSNLGTINAHSYPNNSFCHKHDYHQAIIALDGSMDLESDAGKGVVDCGVFAFVCANREHSYRARGSNFLLTLDIDQNALYPADLPKKIIHARQFFPITPEFRGLISYAKGASKEFDKTDFREALCVLLCHGLQHCIEVSLSRHEIIQERARDYILSNIDRNFSADEIATATCVSLPTLTRILHKQVGQPVGQYVRTIRLERAKYLIQHTRVSLAEVAFACGYSEQSALTRAMRREMGTTPFALRSQYESTSIS